MFTVRRRVSLQDTDATGVLYFGQQFKMALETFEEFLKCKGFGLRDLLNSEYLMPVVHAEGDYLAPVQLDDELTICMKIKRLGTSSITLSFEFFDSARELPVGRVQIVHVTVDRKERVSVPIPSFLRVLLESEVPNLSESIS